MKKSFLFDIDRKPFIANCGVIIFLWMLSLSCQSQNNLPNLPANWPWRGTSLQSVHADYKDVAYLKSININFVRIQLKVPIRAQQEKISPEQAFVRELDWADKILDECKKNNMTSLIAFNHLVFDPKDKTTDKDEKFWNEKKYIDSAYKYMEVIVKRFKDRGNELSAYEVIGEPNINVIGRTEKGKRPPKIEEFFQSILAIIRKYDKERYFLITPGPSGNPQNYFDFDGFNIKDPKLIYGAHMYWPSEYTLQGLHGRKKGKTYPGYYRGKYVDKNQLRQIYKGLIKYRDKNNALVYIGEFSVIRRSQNKDQWIKDVVELLEDFNFSWSYFTYKAGYEIFDPFYEVKNPDADPTLWEIENVGDNTITWQTLKSYFKKNKFTINN